MSPKIRYLFLSAFVLAAPAAAFAQSGQAGLGPANPVPGGITLVPGTVVVPGVGGSAVTGQVPLAGTVGASGVRDFNPGLSAAPGVRATRPDDLYPPAYYPPVPPPMTLQSTLPQNVQGAQGGVSPAPPAPNCINGAFPNPSGC